VGSSGYDEACSNYRMPVFVVVVAQAAEPIHNQTVRRKTCAAMQSELPSRVRSHTVRQANDIMSLKARLYDQPSRAACLCRQLYCIECGVCVLLQKTCACLLCSDVCLLLVLQIPDDTHTTRTQRTTCMLFPTSEEVTNPAPPISNRRCFNNKTPQLATNVSFRFHGCGGRRRATCYL
jgi:hypothetical protein